MSLFFRGLQSSHFVPIEAMYSDHFRTMLSMSMAASQNELYYVSSFVSFLNSYIVASLQLVCRPIAII
jgi:hypothetical protein